jgi:hypothetical protein
MDSIRLYYTVLKDYHELLYKHSIFKDYFYTRKTRFGQYKALIDYKTFTAYNITVQKIIEELLHVHIILCRKKIPSPIELLIKQIKDQDDDYLTL